MKVIIIPALFLVLASTATCDNLWKDCSTPDDKTRMEVTSIKITPDPPQKGQKVNIDVELNLKEEVTSGEVALKLNYGVIPIVDESLDFCDLITQINKQCPLQKGTISIKLDEDLPNYIPSGKYAGNATITDQNNKELLCLHLEMDLN